jgi:hypothetical protein
MSNSDDIIDLNEASLNETQADTTTTDTAETEVEAVRAINGAEVETPQAAAAAPAPTAPVPQMMLAGVLRPEGFIVGLAPRVQGETSLVASFIYQDISLAVTEIEALLRAARQAEIEVNAYHSYHRGRNDLLAEQAKGSSDTAN